METSSLLLSFKVYFLSEVYSIKQSLSSGILNNSGMPSPIYSASLAQKLKLGSA